MPEYKKVKLNENAIMIDGKIVLSFDPRYKEYLKWKEKNPKLEQQLISNLKYPNTDVKQKIANFKFYWENGNIMVRGNLKGNFEISGQWLWYYENGDMQSQVNYRHGFKNGLFQYFYKNGNIKIQGKYKKDKRNGDWLINGKKRKYKDGKEL